MSKEEAYNSLASSEEESATQPLVSHETPTHDAKAHAAGHVGSYGSFVAYCFGVNYVLGVGVLGIPHAFELGGVALGPIALFVVTLIAVLVMIWVIETLARAEAFQSSIDQEKQKPAQEETPKTEYGTAETESEPNTYQTGEETATATSELVKSPNAVQYQITARKFEMNELCSLFMGKVGKIIYEVCITLYMIGGLWSYGSVFAQSMASHVPLPVSIQNGALSWFTCDVYRDGSTSCTILYVVYIGIFALFVVPLTCLNLTEQKALQVFLAVFRFVALGLMTVTIILSILLDPYSRYPKDPGTPMEPRGPYLSKFSLADASGLYQLLPVAIFSQIFHHSLPGLSQPVKNKKHLQSIFGGVFLTTFGFYSFLGVVLAMYYGSHIEPTCSLNFAFFRGGADFNSNKPWWTYPITYLIVLFPAVDVLSAFPLNGITLGNNLHTAFCLGTKSMEKRWVQIIFRLAAAIPPLIGSLFVRDLGLILSYVGLVGFIITFIFPPLLHVFSWVKCNRKFGSPVTPYTYRFFSHPLMTIPVILFALAAIIFCFTMNIVQAVQKKN